LEGWRGSSPRGREHHSDTVIKYSKTVRRKHKNMEEEWERRRLEGSRKKLFCK
jgi:hypothetical protein